MDCFELFGVTTAFPEQTNRLCNVLSTHNIVTIINFHKFPMDTRDGIVLENKKTI